ncbi:MAG TPA: HigA family addiction module antitoxin [Xanthomonadales bacterium]|nr:HigA family addiction module antitoxin [Xanthomonadales bacterium]
MARSTTSRSTRVRRSSTHVGRILVRDFIIPNELNANAVARACGVAAARVYAICEGRHGISPEIAVRLGRYFGVDPHWWLERQAHFDVNRVCSDKGEQIRRIKPLRGAKRNGAPRRAAGSC